MYELVYVNDVGEEEKRGRREAGGAMTHSHLRVTPLEAIREASLSLHLKSQEIEVGRRDK